MRYSACELLCIFQHTVRVCKYSERIWSLHCERSWFLQKSVCALLAAPCHTPPCNVPRSQRSSHAFALMHAHKEWVRLDPRVIETQEGCWDCCAWLPCRSLGGSSSTACCGTPCKRQCECMQGDLMACCTTSANLEQPASGRHITGINQPRHTWEMWAPFTCAIWEGVHNVRRAA